MDGTSTDLDVISGARERTLAVGTARIEVRVQWDWKRAEAAASFRRVHPGWAIARAFGKAVGKLVVRVAHLNLREQVAIGVLDLTQRRYMVDYGSFAKLYSEGKEWSGRSGRPIVTLSPDGMPTPFLPTPLWLLDILAGVTAAGENGAEDVRGMSCRCFMATVDVTRASEAIPGIAVPAVEHFDDLRTLAVEACLDDEHVRRVRCRLQSRTETVDLWDFGVQVDDLDWTRLPTFGTPTIGAGSTHDS